MLRTAVLAVPAFLLVDRPASRPLGAAPAVAAGTGSVDAGIMDERGARLGPPLRAGGPEQARSTVIRDFAASDVAWAEKLMGVDFAGRWQARLGTLVDALACPGLVAERDGRRVGLVTYRDEGEGSVEIVYLEVTERASGLGTALVDEVESRTGARRLWLVTTNDNVDALRFYQRRGFVLVELRPGAVDEARRALKPSIPRTGDHGIPVRDEIVLERHAGAWPGGRAAPR